MSMDIPWTPKTEEFNQFALQNWNTVSLAPAVSEIDLDYKIYSHSKGQGQITSLFESVSC